MNHDPNSRDNRHGRRQRPPGHGGLTAEQLFGASSTVGAARSAAKPKAAARSGPAKTAKFADGTGNTWGGMGKRPRWIRDALEAGKSLEDFLVAGRKAAPAKARPSVKTAPGKAMVAKKAATKKAAPVKAAAPAAAKRPVKAAAKKPAKARAAAATVEPAQATEA